MFSWIYPILVGILIGFLASRIMNGHGKGCVVNLIIGVIGCELGNYLCEKFGYTMAKGDWLIHLIVYVAAAVLFLWVWRLIFGK